MTNTEIIANALKARGMTDDQLSQLLDAYKGDLPFHTIPEWSRRGYHVKADAAPLFECYLWKHTSKPSRAVIEAATEAGEEVPEKSPHFYKKLSHIYSFSQVEKNADETKAAGGIWSKKKSAYWVKPSTEPATAEDNPVAPVPAMQDRPAFTLPPVRLALPAPARLLALPAPKADPEPAPAPVPGPWKKCSFYTIRKEKGDKHPTPHKADGYTDGIFNYYAIGTTSKQWHAIHPVFGLSVYHSTTRQKAQASALVYLDQVSKAEANPTAVMQKYADMMKAAQDGDNLSLF